MSKLVKVELEGSQAPAGTLHHHEEESERALAILNSDVAKYSLGLRRGDLVHVSWFNSYRNNGKFIFDGGRFVGLYTGVDEYGPTGLAPTAYGSILPSFQVITEFPITWWRDVIDHNCTVFYSLTDEEYQEALSNITGGCDAFETFFTKCDTVCTTKGIVKDVMKCRIYINIDSSDDTGESVGSLIEKGLREGVFAFCSALHDVHDGETPDDYTLYLDIFP